MNTKFRFNRVSLLFFFIIGVIFSTSIIFALIKKERYLDFKSGRIRENISIGSVKIFENVFPQSYFEAIPESYIQDENRKWKKVSEAYFFKLFRKMKNYRNAQVLYAIYELNTWLPYIELENVFTVNTITQKSIRSNGNGGKSNYLSHAQLGILTDTFGLKASQKSVLSALSMYGENYFRGTKALARYSGMSIKTARKALKKLCALGLVNLYNDASAGGRSLSHYYRVRPFPEGIPSIIKEYEKNAKDIKLAHKQLIQKLGQNDLVSEKVGNYDTNNPESGEKQTTDAINLGQNSHKENKEQESIKEDNIVRNSIVTADAVNFKYNFNNEDLLTGPYRMEVLSSIVDTVFHERINQDCSNLDILIDGCWSLSEDQKNNANRKTLIAGFKWNQREYGYLRKIIDILYSQNGNHLPPDLYVDLFMRLALSEQDQLIEELPEAFDPEISVSFLKNPPVYPILRYWIEFLDSKPSLRVFTVHDDTTKWICSYAQKYTYNRFTEKTLSNFVESDKADTLFKRKELSKKLSRIMIQEMEEVPI